MKPTLVILAAGLGQRFGGLKQVARVGPSDETILDYSIYDAISAGFGRVVFVIRPDIEAQFRQTFGRRYEARLPVAYAFQRLDDLPTPHKVPPGRMKPWGTGHALLAAADVVNQPFATINADDFYGADAYRELAAFLASVARDTSPRFALAGYRLRDTLSPEGPVNRAVCRCDPEGYLTDLVETEKIEPHEAGGRFSDARGGTAHLDGDTRVSMNLWGFTPAVFDLLRRRFHAFLDEHSYSLTAEFHLPSAVQDMIRAHNVRVQVWPTDGPWCGLTHSADRTRAAALLRKLVEDGVYPRTLWE
jgi:hypothetical protein